MTKPKKKPLLVVKLELREGPSRIGDGDARSAPFHIRATVTAPADPGASWTATAEGLLAVEEMTVGVMMREALSNALRLAMEPAGDGYPAGALRRLAQRRRIHAAR